MKSVKPADPLVKYFLTVWKNQRARYR